MRKTPLLVVSLVLTGSFVAAQGCGGSTTDEIAPGPTVVAGSGGSSAGKAGAAQAGSGGTSQGGTAQGGTAQGGTSGSTSGGTSQGGKAGTSQGGAGGGKAGSSTAGAGGVDLFDASIPDADLGDGSTAAGCYDCTKVECKMELDACAKDPKCGTAAACILTDCLDNPGLACFGQCAISAGFSGLSDPAVSLVTAVAQCTSGKCPNDCPSFGLPGGTGGSGGGSSTGGAGGTSAGGSPQGGSTGTGGFSAATCQNNITGCGQACLSQGLACFQDSACQSCLSALQGGNPPDASCSSNAKFKAVIDCACTKPAQCGGCCLPL